jgi:hypothetical protein
MKRKGSELSERGAVRATWLLLVGGLRGGVFLKKKKGLTGYERWEE